MSERVRFAGPVMVAGRADWWEAVVELAARQGFEVAAADAALDEAALLAVLVGQHVALLLVDDGLPDWRRWVVTVATSPAARRIPVVVVTDELARLESAVDAGATHTLRRDELEEMVPRLLAAQGRVHDADHMETLACQCGEPLPPEGLEAVRLFNSGEYYRQHDVFEAMWMAEAGPVRNLYRAVLQIGVGYYHIQQGNYRGALKMLLRSVQWLTPLPDVCQGVDIQQLRADSAAVRLALEAHLESGAGSFDESVLRPVRLVDDLDKC